MDFHSLAKVGKKLWTNREAFEYLSKYGAHKQAGTLWKNFNTYKESAFENFGLKTYFFLANNLGTPYFNRYDEKSASELSQPLSTVNIPGDGTVTLVSQLGPAMKWADEFDAKLPGANPVKIIHYCNAVHQRAEGTYNPISDDEWNKKLWSNENAYLDLNCRCSGATMWKFLEYSNLEVAQKVCGHVGAWQDPSVRGFVQEVLIHGEPTGKITPFAAILDDDYLAKMGDTCMWEKPHFLENWRMHLTSKNEELMKRKDALWRRLL